jgi:hypothetical protein
VCLDVASLEQFIGALSRNRAGVAVVPLEIIDHRARSSNGAAV